MENHDITTVRKTWFIQSREGKLEDYYNTDLKSDILGTGAFASVVKATTKEGHQPRAIKILRKEKITDKDKFKAEIEILKRLDHPNVIKIFETFEDARNVYIVMEICKGGEVFDRILSKGRFTESEARKVFIDMIHALNYCHANGVCHRDLKPENFLYLDQSEDSHIKIIDFGLAKIFKSSDKDGEKTPMTSRVGTSYYISPEVLAGNYDESCDIWSAGVILYILLSGYPPFNGNTDLKIIEKVKKCAYSLETAEWKKVSESAKDLIKKMLCKPESRLTAAEILKHEWMLQAASANEEPLSLDYQSLKNFTNAQRLKKVALSVIASQLSEEEINELAEQFTKLDVNGDGVLTFEEMEAGLKGVDGKSRDEILRVIDTIDTDRNGTINYTEFVAAAMERSIYLRQDRLIDTFKLLDKDGNGKITAEELKEVLGNDPSFKHGIEYYKEMIKEADQNGDGTIDYGEFLDMMKKNK